MEVAKEGLVPPREWEDRHWGWDANVDATIPQLTSRAKVRAAPPSRVKMTAPLP